MTDAPEWVTLTQGEEILWEAKPSMIPFLTSLTGELILIVLGFGVWLTGGFASVVGFEFNPVIGFLSLPIWTVVGLVLIGWGLLGIARTLVDWWSIHYVVTNAEIYKKSGFVSRTVQNTRLEQVQNTSFNQSLFGRLASYGAVQIDTAGTGGKEIVFEYVEKPDEVIELITRELDRAGV